MDTHVNIPKSKNLDRAREKPAKKETKRETTPIFLLQRANSSVQAPDPAPSLIRPPGCLDHTRCLHMLGKLL